MKKKYDEKYNRTNQSFFLKWDTLERKTNFKINKNEPFTWKEREKLSSTMSTRQILDTVEYKENNELRRIRKWKEIRHFWNVTNNSKEHGGNIENAFWMYGNYPIPVTQFVMALLEEFKFKNDVATENHFRWLYWSLEGGKEGLGDWRELLAATKCITFFRMIKRRPEELLIQLFNIYALGASEQSSSRDDMYLESKEILPKLFNLPLITAYEQSFMTEQLTDAVVRIPHDQPIKRQMFRNILLNNRPLVKYWAELLWKQIPADLRLLALDEIENELIILREEKLMQYLWNKAVKFSNYNIYHEKFKIWKRLCLNTTLIKRQRRLVLERRRQRFFAFWRNFAAFKNRKRRRRVLAEVMGNYTLKARCFARIKLFNYISNKIATVVGHYDNNLKVAAEAHARIRYVWKKHYLRYALHRWHNIVVEMIQDDTAIHKYHLTVVVKYFKEWRRVVREEVAEKNKERMALENQNALRDMMIEVEESTAELLALEMKRREAKQEAEAKAKKEAARYRLELAKQRAQAEKQKEQRSIYEVQRDMRRRVLAKQMKEMKKAFNKEWKEKEDEMVAASIQSATEYFFDKTNAIEIQVRFERLKKEFYASPLDNKEREKVITSVKNIVFLYLEAKMIERGMKLKQIIPQFDLDGKGYLTYDEFRTIVNTLECKVSENQITEVIKGVDTDGDGFVNLKELEEAMEPISQMGVESSPWRFYVDPAQDVLCYHNFKTGVKVLEHNMTKEIFLEIVRSNLTAEYINSTREYVRTQREADWDFRLKNMMAQRIQNMAHLWFGRKLRSKFSWKLEQKRVNERSTMKQTLVSFISRKIRGFKARCRFEQQLHCTWEKVWDVTTQKLFWYNHQLQISTWEKPLLLMRYGDVENPPPWIVYEEPENTPEVDDNNTAITINTSSSSATTTTSQEQEVKKSQIVSYWHVPGQTYLPRKPDGYPICQKCEKNLASRQCIDCLKESSLAEDGIERSFYCFNCYRETHGSPFGFEQKKRPNKLQRLDNVFMLNLARSYHKWQVAKVPVCQMCQSTKINAAFYCEDCNKNMCRPCFRRIHEDEATCNHSYYVL